MDTNINISSSQLGNNRVNVLILTPVCERIPVLIRLESQCLNLEITLKVQPQCL